MHQFIRFLIVVGFAVTTWGSNSQLFAQHDSASNGWHPDPKLVAEFSNRKNHPFNYDESKVPDFELPSVLGRPAEGLSDADWPARRGQLLQLFRQNVYGFRPNFEQIEGFEVSYKVGDETPVDPTGGKSIGQKVQCEIHREGETYTFPFYLYRPVNVTADALPLVILIDNRNFPDPAKMAEEPYEFWPLDFLIGSGFATAVFHTSDVDPDKADGYLQGVRGFLADGKPRESNGWGALSAWGWAASKVLDYAERNLKLDPDHIAVVGHSRGGKTALWAAVEDPRFTIAYSNESGCGGAALSRRKYGETVGRITTSFPHWFCENFAKYAEREHELPVDQHQLIALIAPRATYVASAAEDLWADPRGEYLSLVNAAPAYQLLGKDSITNKEMPPLSQQRIVGQTGYHIRPGKHNLTLVDWENFIRFVHSLQ